MTTAMAARGGSLRWLTGAAVNAVFAMFHPAFAVQPLVPPSVWALVVGAMIFVLPGLCWAPASGATRAIGMRLLRTVAISTIVFLTSLGVIHVCGWSVSAPTLWNLLWAGANVGFLLSLWRSSTPARRRTVTRREGVAATAVFLASFGVFFWGATRVVPPQVDQDLEVLATGFGLLERFEPLLLTDRLGVFFFAHPPLLHFYVAESFVFHDEINELAFYDSVSRRALASRAGLALPPFTEPVPVKERPGLFVVGRAEGTLVEVTPVGGGATIKVPDDDIELGRIYARYRDRPNVVAARAPNMFLAALTVALLCLWVGRISHRTWFGVMVAAAYATSPEVFVRSSYGGYYAIGAFATLLMLIAAERSGRWPRPRQSRLAVLAGGFAALADHKLIVVPMAIGMQQAIAWWRRQTARGAGVRLFPVAVGFAAGAMLFWGWGLSIDPGAFIRDHLNDHFLQRITHENPLGYYGYATPAGLWAELSSHTGFVLLPAGLLLLLRDAFGRHAADRWRPARITWLLWIAISAVAFTAIDWRMTKHVIPLIVPVLLGLAPDRRAAVWRVAVPAAVLAFVLVFNGWALAGLAKNFAAFTITPAW